VSRAPSAQAAIDRRTEEVVAPLRRCFAATPAVERVWLFGSRAQGGADPRSDIDVAVACPDERAWFDLLDRLEELPTLLRIDATRLEDAEPAFREEVARTGRLIHERA